MGYGNKILEGLATVKRQVRILSYQVVSPAGTVLRRNRHQLQLRPSHHREPIPRLVDDEDDDDAPKMETAPQWT